MSKQKAKEEFTVKEGRVVVSSRHCSNLGDVVVLGMSSSRGAALVQATLTRQQFADALFCRQIENVPIEYKESRLLKFMGKEVPAINCKPEVSDDLDPAEIIRDLLRFMEKEVCTHEETHRGGLIWEICDHCDSKWADDEGGKPVFKYPKGYEEAHDYLDALNFEEGNV